MTHDPDWLLPQDGSQLARYVDVVCDPDCSRDEPEERRDAARAVILAIYERERRRHSDLGALELGQAVADHLGSGLTARRVCLTQLYQVEQLPRLSSQWLRLYALAIDTVVKVLDRIDANETVTS